jgi:hypothetical protein
LEQVWRFSKAPSLLQKFTVQEHSNLFTQIWSFFKHGSSMPYVLIFWSKNRC